MRISKRRIEKAKRILAKAEELERQSEEFQKTEREKQRQEYARNRNILIGLREEAIKRIIVSFEHETMPLFEEGEKVRINPYAPVNGWEGTLTSYLRGCKKDLGVSVVTITKRYIDKSYLFEMLDKMESSVYDSLYTPGAMEGVTITGYMNNWEKFYASKENHFQVVGYSYLVEYEGVNLTERYGAGFREPNFVRLGSELEMIILQAYDLELQEKELSRQKEEIRRKKYQIEKDIDKMITDARHKKWEQQYEARKRRDAKKEAEGKTLADSLNIGDVVIVKFNSVWNCRPLQVLEIDNGSIAGFYLDREDQIVIADAPEKEGYVYTKPSKYTWVKVNGEYLDGKFEWDGKIMKKTRSYVTKDMKFIQSKVENPIIKK